MNYSTALDHNLNNKELLDFVDNGSIALHWVNNDGIIKWANKAELDLLGYTAEEYIGHPISEFHTDNDKVEDILARLRAKETLNAYEATLRCKDGSLREVQINSNVLWDEGKFVHTRCFTVDVTEQKRLHNEVHEREHQYRQLLQSMEVPVYTTDEKGRIMLYNRAAVALWGREPVVGQDLWCGSYQIFNPDGSELPLDRCPMAIALREQRAVMGEEIVVVRPDGVRRNVAPHPRPMFDKEGKLVGAMNMLIDITGMKNSETALKNSEARLMELANSLEQKVMSRTRELKNKNDELARSEEKFHRMIEEVEDYAIVLLDKDGVIRNWNKGAQKIKGYTEKEIIGNHFRIFYAKDDQDRGLPETLLHEARTKGKAIHEGWRVRKDGTRFWGSIVITALHDAERNIVGFSKVTRDLTDRKHAEDKQIEYNKLLEFQNKELESFAYAASHDLKEPLRKIHFYNNYIVESQVIKGDEKAQEYMTRSLNAVKRMSTLIDNLLTYSQISNSVESMEDTDLNEIVDDIVLSHKELTDQKTVEFNIAGLPTVPAIRFQMRQLFDNLINNSIKYRDETRKLLISITCEQVPGSVIGLEDADKSKQYFKIAVSDNGIGFDPQYAEKIFEIFQRLSHHTGFKGSGIGLAICKKAIQNHQGYLQAVSEEGQGSTFIIYLPVT